MKSVTIQIDYDDDFDSKANHQMECLTTVNGRLYHDQLKEIYDILALIDKSPRKKDKLSKDAQAIVEVIRRLTAPYFKGVCHGD